MEEFITKVSILKDVLATTEEMLKESEIILIALGALNDDYESFVTSITTQYDLAMTFASLCELLIDQEMRLQRKANPLFSTESVNTVVNKESKSAQSDFKCLICGRKGHSALNCYNRINLKRFPPTHNRELSATGPTSANRGSANAVNLVATGEPLVWCPDFGATSHITSSADNIQRSRPFSGKQSILIVDGSPLSIHKISHNLVTNSLNRSFALCDLLHVPSVTRQ